MSYYSNNPLTFPSYNQNQMPQRNHSGIAGILGQPKEAQLINRNHQIGGQNHHNAVAAPNHQQQQSGMSSVNQPTPVSAVNGQISEDKTQKRERRNRPGQKFGAKKKSWVWTWFVQDSQDPNIAACDYCGKIITRLASDKGSPKKLSEHLKTHKLSKDSINNTRPIPIDGNGITYAPNGVPLGYTSHFNGNSNTTNSPNPPSLTTTQPQSPEAPAEKKKKRPAGEPVNYNLNSNNRRFLSTDFDNSPYTSMKFHRHLLKFLTENKLSINVIKSHSFQQLIYDLRSDSVTELLELTGLYSSLLEVSRFDGPNNGDSSSMPSMDEANVANTIAQAVEQKANGNVN